MSAQAWNDILTVYFNLPLSSKWRLFINIFNDFSSMIWFSPHVSLSLCSDHCKMWSRSLGSFNRNYHEGFEYFGRCLSFLNSTALQSCQMQSWNCTGVQLTLKVEFKDSCSLGHRDWVNDGRGKRATWPFPQPQLSHICHTFFFSLMLL